MRGLFQSLVRLGPVSLAELRAMAYAAGLNADEVERHARQLHREGRMTLRTWSPRPPEGPRRAP